MSDKKAAGGTGVNDPRYPKAQDSKSKRPTTSAQDFKFDEPVPVIDSDFSNIIVVDGLPRVEESKEQKLNNFIKQFFTKIDNGGKIVDVFMPIENKSTVGYGFIEYENKEGAEMALKAKDDKALDAKHKLKILRYSEFESTLAISDEYKAPSEGEYKRESKNFSSWLLDDFGRDQFVLRLGDETQICWNDPIRRSADADQGMEVYYDGAKKKKTKETPRGIEVQPWVKKWVRWSPKGSYLATCHDQGIKLWGGPEFTEIAPFEHKRVTHLDFSPCEKFLVTGNFEGNDAIVTVWDITRMCVKNPAVGAVRSRTFRIAHEAAAKGQWPVFQWSHDDKYFSNVEPNTIKIYATYEIKSDVKTTPATPPFALLDKKAIEVKGVVEASWSPGANIICYWLPESKNQPATIAMRSIAPGEREIVREKNLYSVENIQMHWQSTGEFLCLKISRKKSKKTFTTNFEVFRMRERDIPIEVIELEDPHITHFAWEPRGRIFSVIHGTEGRTSSGVSFYKVQKKATQLLFTLSDRQADRMYWSPAGGVVVLASFAGANARMEFYDVKNNQRYNEVEHFKAQCVEWDPSGRYVFSIASQKMDEKWQYASENGYKVWNSQGGELMSVLKDNLYQVLWRPRPPSLLDGKQVAEIKSTLRSKYWAEFEAEVQKIKSGNQSAAVNLRKQLAQEWRSFLKECEDSYANDKADRVDLRNGEQSDDEDDMVMSDITTQTLISLKEERITEGAWVPGGSASNRALLFDD